MHEVEEYRVDPELARPEFAEDFLCVERPVIVPDPGMIPADDEVGEPVVLANLCVEDRLPRAGITHPCREAA